LWAICGTERGAELCQFVEFFFYQEPEEYYQPYIAGKSVSILSFPNVQLYFATEAHPASSRALEFLLAIVDSDFSAITPVLNLGFIIQSVVN